MQLLFITICIFVLNNYVFQRNLHFCLNMIEFICFCPIYQRSDRLMHCLRLKTLPVVTTTLSPLFVTMARVLFLPFDITMAVGPFSIFALISCWRNACNNSSFFTLLPPIVVNCNIVSALKQMDKAHKSCTLSMADCYLQMLFKRNSL